MLQTEGRFAGFFQTEGSFAGFFLTEGSFAGFFPCDFFRDLSMINHMKGEV
jgi:hypothetical protein